jgi:hypothetical protein
VVGDCLGHVGAGSLGEREAGGFERRHIVDPVGEQRGVVLAGAQRIDELALVERRAAGDDCR